MNKKPDISSDFIKVPLTHLSIMKSFEASSKEFCDEYNGQKWIFQYNHLTLGRPEENCTNHWFSFIKDVSKTLVLLFIYFLFLTFW